MSDDPKEDFQEYGSLFVARAGELMEHFKVADANEQMLVLVEEVGELARALVKRKQGIRGTHEQWTAEAKKEMSDVLIALAGVAYHESHDLFGAATDDLMLVLNRMGEVAPRMPERE